MIDEYKDKLYGIRDWECLLVAAPAQDHVSKALTRKCAECTTEVRSADGCNPELLRRESGKYFRLLEAMVVRTPAAQTIPDCFSLKCSVQKPF